MRAFAIVHKKPVCIRLFGGLIFQSSSFYFECDPGIGQHMDKAAVEAALRACLVTDEELKLGDQALCEMPDPFAEQWNKGLGAPNFDDLSYEEKEPVYRKASEAEPDNVDALCALADHLSEPGACTPFTNPYFVEPTLRFMDERMIRFFVAGIIR